MKCFYCKEGQNADGFTTDVTELGTHVIIIRNVPCQKCKQCGEITYTLDVSERLERIVDDLRESVTEISVLQYERIAA